MPDKYIVVLHNSQGHKEDRSWACHQSGEAELMAKWLSNNHIEATAHSLTEWNSLPERNDQ